ncbi:YTH domain-containing protein, partial [Morchella snyderi]
SRFFVIKSNCELDIFASLKHGIWTSTDLGNKRLDRAFCDHTRKGPIFLFFSVSGSGKFCGIAEMTSAIEHSVHTGIWSDKRWRGRFTVAWLIVKDIPNTDLRQFRVANNDNKPFTNCRDTQEILIDPGESVYNLFSRYVSPSSVFQSSFEEQRCGNDELHQV